MDQKLKISEVLKKYTMMKLEEKMFVLEAIVRKNLPQKHFTLLRQQTLKLYYRM